MEAWHLRDETLRRDVELLVGAGDVDRYDSLLRRSFSRGARRRERLGWEWTHQFRDAVRVTRGAGAWDFLGQFKGLDVLAGGLVERVDDGVFGESGLG